MDDVRNSMETEKQTLAGSDYFIVAIMNSVTNQTFKWKMNVDIKKQCAFCIYETCDALIA